MPGRSRVIGSVARYRIGGEDDHRRSSIRSVLGLVVCPRELSALCLRRLGKLLGELAEDTH
jgi:hypothetical protein